MSAENGSSPRLRALVDSGNRGRRVLEQFDTYLEARKRTEQTIDRYKPTAREFVVFTGKTSNWTKSDIQQFLADKSTHGAKGSYLRYVFGALKSFFRSQDLQWPMTREDLPALNEPNMPFYNYQEVKKLCGAAAELVADATASNTDIDTTFAYMVGLRDFLLVKTAAIVGCRRNELTTLDRRDYDPKGGRLYVHTSKHGRPGWRALDKEAVKWLNEYLSLRKDRHAPLFLSTRHDGERRLDAKALYAVLEKVCRKARVENKGWHAFRRGFVTDAYDRGAREKDLVTYLGWKSENMVFRYIRLAPSRAEASIKAASSHFQEKAR